MPAWTLEAKRILKEYVEVIEGNEATVLALYQVAPFHSLGKPDELKKLLTSLSTTKPMVDDAFTHGVEAIEHTLSNMVGQLKKLREQYAMGDIAIRDAKNNLNKILKEIGKWKP